MLASGVLVALAAGFLAGQDRPLAQSGSGKTVAGPKREADEEAIRKQSAALVQAFDKGDAKALAALWTEEGEYIDDDGTTYRGRAAIEAGYAKFFAAHPKRKLELTIDAIRFVSRDSAIEEGHARSQVGKGESSSRYSVLHVRENGKWRLAIVREWPSQGTSMRDLDWLIGTWANQAEETEVKTTYEWDEGKKFIRGRFTIKGKDGTQTGTQMIGQDPRTGLVRSWVFEAAGGFGEAVWTRDGKRWTQEAAGIQADGSEISATNILTPLNKDAFTFQSTNRVVDGEEVPNSPPLKITRVK
jgi:uncharacterized protein (TIGR02246 family)